MPYVIRKAVRADVPAVCELVKELAKYEKMSNEVKFTPEIFVGSIFEKNYARILVCETEGKIIAYAIYFYTFSTFLGLGGMYLEDLYVQKEHRNKGIGKEFFTHLAQICNASSGRVCIGTSQVSNFTKRWARKTSPSSGETTAWTVKI